MKPRMIILEGPDGAGKSTIGKWLSIWLADDWTYIHTGGPLASREDFRKRVRELKLDAPDKNMIVDRSPYISDGIYSIVNGRPPVTTMGDLADMMASVKPVLVYCRLHDQQQMLDSILTTAKAHKPPEYLERVKAQHSEIVRRYDELMADLNPIRYDWTRHPPTDLTSRILARLRACAD